MTLRDDLLATDSFEKEVEIIRATPIPFITETGEVGERDFTPYDVYKNRSVYGDEKQFEEFVLQNLLNRVYTGEIPLEQLEKDLGRVISPNDFEKIRNRQYLEDTAALLSQYSRTPIQPRPQEREKSRQLDLERREQRYSLIERMGGFPLGDEAPEIFDRRDSSSFDLAEEQRLRNLGIDPTKYLSEVRGLSVADMFLNSEEAALKDHPELAKSFKPTDKLASRLLPGPNSPYGLKNMVSFQNKTQRDLKDLFRNEDPNAIFIKTNPKDEDSPWAIVSEKITGTTEPVLIDALYLIDPRNRTDAENLGVMVEQFLPLVSQEILPELLGVGGANFVVKNVNKAHKKLLDDFVEDTTSGTTRALERLGSSSLIKRGLKATGKVGGVAAAIGIGTATARFAQLLYAEKSGIHPDLDIKRALEDSGLVAAWAALPAAGVEAAVRVFQEGVRRVRGKNIPDEIINELIVSARQAKNRKAVEDEVEYSFEEIDEALDGVTDNYLETIVGPIRNKNEYEQSLMLVLLHSMDESDPARVAVQRMFEQQGKALTTFYEKLSRKATRKNQKVPTLEEFQRIFNDINSEAAQREKELLQQESKKLSEEFDEYIPTVVSEMPLEEAVQGTIKRNVLSGRESSELIQRQSEILDEADDEIENIISSLEGTGDIKQYLGQALKGKQKSEGLTVSVEAAQAAQAAKQALPVTGEAGSIGVLEKYNRSLTGKTDKDGNPLKPIDSPLRLLTDNLPEGYPKFDGQLSVQDAYQILKNFEAVSADRTLLPTGKAQKEFEQLTLSLTDFILDNTPPEQTARLISAIEEKKLLRNNQASTAFLKTIVDPTKSDQEIALSIMGAGGGETDKLIQLLHSMPKGAERLESVRSAVVSAVKAELDKAGDGAKRSAKLREIYSEYGESLDVLFPDNNFRNANKWLETAERDIAKTSSEIERLNKEIENLEIWNALEGGAEIGSRTPSGTLVTELSEQFKGPRTFPNFIKMFAELKDDRLLSQAFQDLKKLSAQADKNPKLRSLMQDSFRAFLRETLEGSTYRSVSDANRLFNPQGFNLEKLSSLVSGPYEAGKAGTKNFSQVLELILGKRMGRDYAKNLRILEKELRTARGKLSSVSEGTPQMGGAIQQDYQEFSRLTLPQLSTLGRRLNTLFGRMGANARGELLGILTDPKKLEEFIKFKDRQMNNRQFIRYLSTLMTDATEYQGSESPRSETLRNISELRSVMNVPNPLGL